MEKIEKTAEIAWEAIKEYYCEEFEKRYPEVKFNENKKSNFINRFKCLYKEVQTEYMKNKDNALDRHKQAALLICAVLEEEILETDIKDKIFVAKYSMALSLGLAFLRIKLNKILESKNISGEIDDLTDIIAWACPTNYFDVLFRNLYFEEKKMGSVFALTLANTLFLLEYIALMKIGVDVNLLVEYDD